MTAFSTFMQDWQRKIDGSRCNMTTNNILVHDERLADHHDDGHARRNWGIQLYIDGMAARIESAVDRVLANQVPCPQGKDCQGDGRQRRIFDCEHRCGFRGCVVCLIDHEASCEKATRLCAHCRKEVPVGSGPIFYRGVLLHQECRIPFIVDQRGAASAEEEPAVVGGAL